MAYKVSIRSPYRSKGRYKIARGTNGNGQMGFNPLPLPKQGEIKHLEGDYRQESMFQSAPLTEARGDLLPFRNPGA